MLIGMIFFEKFKNMFRHMVCLEKNSTNSDQILVKNLKNFSVDYCPNMMNIITIP